MENSLSLARLDIPRRPIISAANKTKDLVGERMAGKFETKAASE
jgi:hypothetical protein